MPNTKISALTSATTLAGTETLPVVQSTTTKKTTINAIIQDKDIARFGRTSGVIDRLIDYTGATVSGNTIVTSWDDLLTTYPAASNTGMTAIVDNAGDNTVGIPFEAYSNGTEWLVLGGDAMLGDDAPMMTITAPAATFVPGGGYTLSQGATAQETKIASGGIHGLTTGISVGAYINISASTGGSIPWTVGLYKITAITLDTTGTDITVLRDYNATLGQPTITLINNEIEVLRHHVPALTDTGSVRFDLHTKNTGTNGKRTRVRFGVLGVALASATEFFNSNDTTATQGRLFAGIRNYDAVTNKNVGFHASASTSGVGTTTTAIITGTVQTNAGTDIIVSVHPTVANDVVQVLRFVSWFKP
jgi:hypothetical protein